MPVSSRNFPRSGNFQSHYPFLSQDDFCLSISALASSAIPARTSQSRARPRSIFLPYKKYTALELHISHNRQKHSDRSATYGNSIFAAFATAGPRSRTVRKHGPHQNPSIASSKIVQLPDSNSLPDTATTSQIDRSTPPPLPPIQTRFVNTFSRAVPAIRFARPSPQSKPSFHSRDPQVRARALPTFAGGPPNS